MSRWVRRGRGPNGPDGRRQWWNTVREGLRRGLQGGQGPRWAWRRSRKVWWMFAKMRGAVYCPNAAYTVYTIYTFRQAYLRSLEVENG